MSVSRPNTAMNQGIPAAKSWPPAALSCMRSEARSATERSKVVWSVGQLARSVGTCIRQAWSDARTRSSSAPNNSSAPVSVARTPSGETVTSTRSRHCSPGSSASR